MNQACAGSRTPFLATLNDDAVADPRWLEELLAAMESASNVGMCASQVRLFGREQLDSAGMLICADGSSKQRGHLAPPPDYGQEGKSSRPAARPRYIAALCWTKSAALTRISFCTARIPISDCAPAGPDGGALCAKSRRRSSLFPHGGAGHAAQSLLCRAEPALSAGQELPAAAPADCAAGALARYAWHVVSLLKGRGVAARFREDGHGALGLLALVIRAHWSLLRNWSRLWDKRRAIARTARISPAAFAHCCAPMPSALARWPNCEPASWC